MKLGAGLLLVFLAGGLDAAPTRAEVRRNLDQTRLEKKQLDKKLLQSRLTVKQHAKEEKNILGQIYGNMRELSAAKRDMQVHVKNLTLVEDRLATLKVR